MTFAEAMNAPERQLAIKATILTVDGFSFTATEILAFSVDEGGQMPLGSVTSARYTLELPNANGEYQYGGSVLGNRTLIKARVTVQIGAFHDNAWDWQPAGVFVVEKTSAGNARIKLTGQDPLVGLDVLYNDTLKYTKTTTLNNILTHIKSKGIPITGNLVSDAVVGFEPDWGEEPTLREVLGYVTQMGGCFVRCNRSGVVEIVPAVGGTNHAITTDKYLDFTDDERFFNFNRVKVLPAGAKKDRAFVEAYITNTPETAANTIVIEGNPLFKTRTSTSYYKATSYSEGRQYYVYDSVTKKYTAVPKEENNETHLPIYYSLSRSYNTTNLSTMVTNLKTALTGLAFRAINVVWRGNPQVQIGDSVTITDKRGVSTTTVVMQQTIRFEQGLKATISCPLDLEAVSPLAITSSGKVLSPYFGEGTIDGKVIISNSLVGAQIADGSITNSQIKGGTITGTEIADSTIKNSHFQDGTISGSIFEDGTITGSKFVDGTIENTHIKDGTIEGTKIKDTTITGSKFVEGTIEGTHIKGGTIDGTHIYNGTADNLKITNASIQDGAITNAKIANATIETAKIKDAAITTAKIQDAQITNAKIASAGIDFLKVKNSVLDTAIFREIVAGGDVYIDRLKVADANITNLTVGNLMVKRPDGTLHRIYVDGNGNLQTELVELLYQNLSSDALLKVSEWTVYKKETAPSSPYVGQLWVKPSTGIMQKCLTITPSVTWGDVKAGELHTSYIDAVAKGLNILTGGELNVLGGSVNIKSLDGVANVINMDNTGLTLSSTGQLKLQSTDSIIIGGSPFGVGGTNLIRAADISSDMDSWKTSTDWYFYETFTGMEKAALVSPVTDSYLNKGTYTLSFYARGNLDDPGQYSRVRISTSPSGDGVNYTTLKYVPITSDLYKRVEYTFTLTSAMFVRLEIYNHDFTNYNTTVFFRRPKLESGNMATDWSPAPEDPASGVKTSYIDIATDHIDIGTGGNLNVASGGKINVSATDLMISGKTVETYASESINMVVGGVKISAQNLLKRSADLALGPWTHTLQGTSTLTFRTDRNAWLLDAREQSDANVIARIQQNLPGKPNTEYVLTAEYVFYGTYDKHYIYIQEYDGSTMLRQKYVPRQNGALSYSFTTGENTTELRFYIRANASLAGATPDGYLYIYKPMIIEGNKSSPWMPHYKDPASGVKTSSVEVNTNGIYMDTTGEISLNSGASMRIKSGTVQIEAGDATDSHLQFGDAFAVGKDAGGNYALSINSRSDDAIKINNKSVWHKGNIVVQQAQPPGGKQTVWLKPNATTSVMYQHTITATNTSYYTNTGSLRSYALAAQSGDTMSVAGTYSFSVTMTFKRFGGAGLATYDTTGGTVQLKKGGQTLTLSALPALSLKPWAERTVTVTGSTTSTAFTSATGDITCEVTVTGAKPYNNDDFLAHGRPSDVSCAITGPGGAAAQACQVFYVP